jgi:bifunctional non-homologous end joining protein LigD
MKMPIKQISLYFKSGNSDKEYHAQIEQHGKDCHVNFQYGRRGSTLTGGTKTSEPVSLAKAEKIYEALVKSKTDKGYTEGAAGTPFVGSAQQDRATGLVPQLLNPIDESELESYLKDDSFGCQEKEDGKHILIRVIGGVVTGSNRKGLQIGLPEPIVKAATDLEDCVLDGEGIGDRFYAFDLLERRGQDVTSLGYQQRYEFLSRLCSNVFPVVPLAIGEQAKRALYLKLKAENKEGIVFKKLSASYIPGRPSTGGDMLKFKFYATASCIVTAGREGKRSVGLAVLCDGLRVVVGNVTVPANQNVPKVDQVVEIRYLYAYKGGSLYQPVLLGVRDDINPNECLIKQLKYKAEED